MAHERSCVELTCKYELLRQRRFITNGSTVHAGSHPCTSSHLVASRLVAINHAVLMHKRYPRQKVLVFAMQYDSY